MTKHLIHIYKIFCVPFGYTICVIFIKCFTTFITIRMAIIILMKAKIKYVSGDGKKINLFGKRFSEMHDLLAYIYKSQEYNIKSFRKRKLKVMEIKINWEKL